MSTKPFALPATQANSYTAGKTWVMRSSGTDVLKVTTSTDTKCISGDGTLHFNGPVLFDEVEFWQVHGVKSLDEAIAHVNSQIIDQFKDFQPEHTTDLTITGSPAKQLIGPGHEADDGDNGAADVIVFKVSDCVFIACYHGESLEPLGQQWMLSLVQTARLP